MTAKQQFTNVWTRENATTRKVLCAIPADQCERRAGENTRTAREIATIFSRGQRRMAAALSGEWQWPPPFREAPTAWTEVLEEFNATSAAVRDALANVPDSRFDDKITFLTGPKQPGEIPVSELVWFMLLDSVHHRGQLSIYLRLMNATVPSIYGPTKEEPWM